MGKGLKRSYRDDLSGDPPQRWHKGSLVVSLTTSSLVCYLSSFVPQKPGAEHIQAVQPDLALQRRRKTPARAALEWLDGRQAEQPSAEPGCRPRVAPTSDLLRSRGLGLHHSRPLYCIPYWLFCQIFPVTKGAWEKQILRRGGGMGTVAKPARGSVQRSYVP